LESERVMIRVTRLNQHEMVLNAEMIKFVERTPDTIVTLSTGEKIVVRETPEQVVDRVVEYGRRLRILPEKP